MRLSLDLRVPLGDILSWPAWQVDAYAAFLDREPPQERRLEMLLARIAARVFNATRSQGSPAVDPSDFLLPRDLWTRPLATGLTTGEQNLMAALHRAVAPRPD